MAKINSASVAGGGVELKRAFVAGAAANANLAVAGLKLNAKLVSVVEWAAGVPTDRTAVSSVSAAGVLHVNDDTTGNTVEVLYLQGA